MNIEHPRRLLVVGRPNCDLIGLIKNLTGSRPTQDASGSIAGSIHEWHLTTPYYTADIPMWIDEIVDLDQWKAEFSKPEAREVIEALGGWIYCFNKVPPSSMESRSVIEDEARAGMEAIESVINKACGYNWEGMKLAVAMSAQTAKPASLTSSKEEMEDLCMNHGFEFIDADATGKNEFGEAQGLDRIKESVETNDWNATVGIDEDEDNAGSFADEQAQMNAELWGLKASLLSENDEDDDAEPSREDLEVDNLEGLMQQAMAIREQGADMPLEERKRFAAKAIDDLMKNV
ncbi:hypothetical protein BDZ85DRAFT_73273 [Elsinoe ampelina]|uniref:Alpha and gamma adaptin binding protein p34-domain-containing protein n=1 Tax=Elsinoe ampelina TaxID=302913 RepID=A0A6A6GKB2_9PEZI|nr:hypothetical protein BDZ85DRAFT_73273 [Elsinoe ampelina]